MIRLLLVDDVLLVRQGFKAMFDNEEGIEVVGVADNGQSAIDQAEALQPDIVLMDVEMPVMDGRQATRIICQKFPNIKVLVVSTFDDSEYIAHSIQAGAKGYLLKDMPIDDLVTMIKLVYRGYNLTAPGLMERMPYSINDKSDRDKQLKLQLELANLTPREIDVTNLLCDGFTNKQIGEKLHITEGTVKTHVTKILNKLSLNNRVQISKYFHTIDGEAC